MPDAVVILCYFYMDWLITEILTAKLILSMLSSLSVKRINFKIQRQN